MPPDEVEEAYTVDARLHRRTVLKLDCILLPFLALLFLFNALDKSNVSRASYHVRESRSLTVRCNR
jgi:hypothetical protein